MQPISLDMPQIHGQFWISVFYKERTTGKRATAGGISFRNKTHAIVNELTTLVGLVKKDHTPYVFQVVFLIILSVTF